MITTRMAIACAWALACGGTTLPTGPIDPAASADAASDAAAGDAAAGARIFDSGLGVNGQPLAYTGGAGMGGMMDTCASCHGADGHGRTTMLFTSPNITYRNLTDPLGMIEPDGTRGMTYTDDLIRRAVTQGVDADGDALDATMPRWQLDDEDWQDLLAYLKTLQ